jgi:hypothetical protein
MPDIRTLYLREQGVEDKWLLFEAKRGPRAKQYGKHFTLPFCPYNCTVCTIQKPHKDSLYSSCRVLWGTALQDGRSRIRFPRVSLKFFIDTTFRPHCDPGVDSATNRRECEEYFLRSKGGRCIGLHVPIVL